MAHYGVVIDEFASVNDEIYKIFCKYFENPIMTKMKNQENKFSMYVSKAYCLLSKECRYIIVFTQIDNFPIGFEQPLQNIYWISLQTRTLADQYDIKSHGYTPMEKGPLLAKIHRVNITQQASTYKCDEFPLIITLLHTPKKTSDVYQDKGTIIAALETWETIITFNEN